MSIRCVECGSTQVSKYGKVWRKIDGGRKKDVQQYRCGSCGRVFRVHPNNVTEEKSAEQG